MLRKDILLRNLSWDTTHNIVLVSIQNNSRKAIELTFSKGIHEICVYTESTEEIWTGIVTQTSTGQLTEGIGPQEREPIALLGGKLAGAQHIWKIYEIEACAIVQTFNCMDYLL